VGRWALPSVRFYIEFVHFVSSVVRVAQYFVVPK
jgi:hypothetical protein